MRHGVSLPAILLLGLILAGCVDTPSQILLEIVTVYDESPYERQRDGTTHGHDAGRLANGSRAVGGVISIGILRPLEPGEEPVEDGGPFCTMYEECPGAALDVYPLSNAVGWQTFPLGADGRVRLVLDEPVENVAIRVGGRLPRAPPDCGIGAYLNEPAAVIVNPEADVPGRLMIHESTEAIVPFVVRCSFNVQ